MGAKTRVCVCERECGFLCTCVSVPPGAGRDTTEPIGIKTIWNLESEDGLKNNVSTFQKHDR